MVLKRYCLFLLVGLFLGGVFAQAEPSSPGKRMKRPRARSSVAPKMIAPKNSEDANKISQEAQQALASKDYARAERLSYGMVLGLKWWPDFVKTKETSGVDLTAQLDKTSKGFLTMMWVAGTAKANRYDSLYKKLPANTRREMKKEITALYDALMQSNFDSAKAEEFNQVMLATDSRIAKSIYTWKRAGVAKLFFWPDTGSSGGADVKIYGQGFCVGGTMAYRNEFNDFSFGGCYGMGKSAVVFSDSTDVNAANETIIAANVTAVRKYNNGHIGIGYDAQLFNHTTKMSAPPAGKSGSISSMHFAQSLVLRTIYDYFYVDFKGGKILGVPSAIWSVEVGVPF